MTPVSPLIFFERFFLDKFFTILSVLRYHKLTFNEGGVRGEGQIVPSLK